MCCRVSPSSVAVATSVADQTCEKTTLDSGLRIITCNMPHTRSASMVILIGTGSRYEDDSEAGVSHFIEHLCFKGTEKRPLPQQISATVEGVGGMLNGSTDQEVTAYWAKVALPHFPQALDLLVDMLRNSRFDPEDIEKERRVILEELNMVKDAPNQWVEVLLDQIVWPGHPLGRDIGGTRESIEGISRSQILDFFESHYSPNNTVVSVAGAVDHQEVVEALASRLDGWRAADPCAFPPAPDAQDSPCMHVEYRKTEQVHLNLAVRGLPVIHPDRYALDLLNVVLGDGMSSRLFVELRENRGLAYNVYSYNNHYIDCGALCVAAGVDPSRTAETLAGIINELQKLKDGITESELETCKELVKGRLLLRTEDTRSVAGWFGAQEVITGQVMMIDDVVRHVEAVTLEDVRRVAQTLLHTEKLNLAVVGPTRARKGLQALLKV